MIRAFGDLSLERLGSLRPSSVILAHQRWPNVAPQILSKCVAHFNSEKIWTSTAESPPVANSIFFLQEAIGL